MEAGGEGRLESWSPKGGELAHGKRGASLQAAPSSDVPGGEFNGQGAGCRCRSPEVGRWCVGEDQPECVIAGGAGCAQRAGAGRSGRGSWLNKGP